MHCGLGQVDHLFSQQPRSSSALPTCVIYNFHDPKVSLLHCFQDSWEMGTGDRGQGDTGERPSQGTCLFTD